MSNIETQILKEQLFTKEHIDEIYILFVNICDNNRFNITPLNFIKTFNNISEKKQILSIEKKTWDQKFMMIDSDKDGLVTFPDFIRFIYDSLKISLNCIDRRSIAQIK